MRMMQYKMENALFTAMHSRHIEALSLPTTLVIPMNLTLVTVSVVRIFSSVFIKATAQFGSLLASSWASLLHFSSSVFPCPITEITHTHPETEHKKKKKNYMGLSNIPNLAEEVLPVLLVNTFLSVVLLKNMMRSVLEAVGLTSSSSSSSSSSSYAENTEEDTDDETERESWRRRRVSITQYKVCSREETTTMTTTPTTSDSGSSVGLGTVECCVCLCGFEANQEVSELPCKHFFHRGCLDKWFDNKHLTCPLCRSRD